MHENYLKCFFCKFEAVKHKKDTEKVEDFISSKPNYIQAVNDDYFKSKCELCGFMN